MRLIVVQNSIINLLTFKNENCCFGTFFEVKDKRLGDRPKIEADSCSADQNT